MSKMQEEKDESKTSEWNGSPAFFQQGLSCSFAIVVVIWEK